MTKPLGTPVPHHRLLIPSGVEALRRNNFDAIRIAMALLVVWSHCFALYLGSERSEPLSRLLGNTTTAGTIGVDVFFIISGFLICQSYLASRTLATYLEKRVRRIYPGYLAATVIGALVIVPLYSSRGFGRLMPLEIAKVFGLNALLRNYAPPSDVFASNALPGALNGSLWSIPFEFWCYLGLIALGLSGLLTRRRAIVAIIAVVMLIKVWLDLTGRKPGGGMLDEIIGWRYLWFSVLPNFLLGTACYMYRDILPRSRLALAVGLAVLLMATHLPVAAVYRDTFAGLLLPPVLAAAVFHLAFSDTIRWRNAAAFGDFSYGTYLYAFPIQQMLAASFGHRISFPLYIAASLALSLGAGVLSWFLVERRFLPTHRTGGPGLEPLGSRTT